LALQAGFPAGVLNVIPGFGRIAGQALVDQIRITSEDLKLVKVLDPTTDPKAFAERITVNLLA